MHQRLARSIARRAALLAAALFFASLSAHAELPAGRSPELVAETIHAQAPNISAEAISAAIHAYAQVRQRHLTDKPFVTIVDYSLPSTKKRLVVADVRTGRVLFYTYVAHGKGSGLRYATRFSNKPGTNTSSLGVYLTGHTYYGKHGYSLRLKGLNPEFNGATDRKDNLYTRRSKGAERRLLVGASSVDSGSRWRRIRGWGAFFGEDGGTFGRLVRLKADRERGTRGGRSVLAGVSELFPAARRLWAGRGPGVSPFDRARTVARGGPGSVSRGRGPRCRQSP